MARYRGCPSGGAFGLKRHDVAGLLGLGECRGLAAVRLGWELEEYMHPDGAAVGSAAGAALGAAAAADGRTRAARRWRRVQALLSLDWLIDEIGSDHGPAEAVFEAGEA